MTAPEKKYAPETVRRYLARGGRCRNGMEWDNEVGAFQYDVHTVYVREDTTQKDVDSTAKVLPFVVPGLKVVRAELRRSRSYKDTGIVWFTWDRESMWARYRELFEEYGAADERLAYQQCSGTVYSPDGQQRIPGVVDVEPRSTGGWGIGAAWTRYGLMQMDGGFCHRILDPNRGGLEAVPHGSQRATVGNEWWLVGSRGDSPEVLSLEIQGSPLHDETKENLLYNLGNCYGDHLPVAG
jgi:hypothetical protein